MYGFIRDILNDKGSTVYTTVPTATVCQAVRAMNEYGVGALLVEAGGQPVGIFSERDVLRRVVDPGLPPHSTRVGDVMTAELIVISPGATVEEAMATMTNRRVRHLPVIDNGRVTGLVSIGDVMRRVSLGQATEIRHLVDYITGRQG